jgi:hypothetical protein
MELMFNEPMSFHGGSGSVTFPPFSKQRDRVVFGTHGTVAVGFPNAVNEYGFSDIDQRAETDTHWVEAKTKANPRDGKYLDVLFGEKRTSPHVHFGYVVEARMLFAQNRVDADLRSLHVFDKSDGGVVCLERTIQDKNTGMGARLRFTLNRSSDLIDLVELTISRLEP